MKKVVVITGASSGIGLETANYLASKGYIVYGLSKQEYVSKNFKHLCCDVTDEALVQTVFNQIYNEQKRIDVVINNAGLGISGAIEYVTKQDVDKIFEVNVKAVIMVSKIALPYLRQTQGKIINTSSVAACFSIPFQACYSATKSAIESFSLALSNEVKSQKIKVCCVRPGDTKTGFTQNRIKTEVENDVYGKCITKSVQKMEKDEQNGASPIVVSKLMYKCIKRKNPPLVCTVGLGYKFLCLLGKIVPTRFANFIVDKLY